ncbi:uncharacterized protein YukE [Jatrophihabitans sp. GAS493]|uniref:type VII secretion target n=1 Tax=Jatrophihabitans sp. GAS493 TaxID=1907575 RepID=UPI000BB7FDEA|nr:type VII secretion target [Jatrophihabitans sp. GAS493]SOD72406.1 uncharacterized protein YukE [Jatrophihabitans sp. GAS493]
MADSYTVDTEVLRHVASDLGGQASAAPTLMDGTATGVPSGSWGALGDSLGLNQLYTDVHDQADRTLARIHDFLLWSADTLNQTAVEYDDREQATARHFRAIGDDSGSGRR